jgi:hypothetical protein
VNLPVGNNPFGASLADQVIGSSFDQSTEAGVRRSTRYQMVNQLAFDPTGQFGGSLPADQAVILAFGDSEVLSLRIGNVEPRRNANVLYYVPVGIGIHGAITFNADLLRPTIIDSNAQFFQKDRSFLSMGAGSATLAYRPIPFEGRLTASQIQLSLSSNPGQGPVLGGEPIAPLPSIPVACTNALNTLPAGCAPRRADLLPEVEVFDRTGQGTWARLPRLTADTTYTLADPARYVDPATGQVLIRFINDNPDSSAGFGFQLVLAGDVE